MWSHRGAVDCIQTIDESDLSRKFLRAGGRLDLHCAAARVRGTLLRRAAGGRDMKALAAFAQHRGEFVMLRLAAIVLAGFMSITVGHAAEVKVLAALAVQDALGPLALHFWRERGHTVRVDYSTVGAIRKRLAGGERADVVVVTSEAADEMERAGELVAGTNSPVAATRTGLAIRDGAAAPDISTLEKFRAALLAARSVAYTDPQTGGAFGTYFAKELDRLGILAAVNAKAVLRRGSHEIVKAVANGDAEVGVTFISTIVSTPGLRVAGPLPPPLLGLERFSTGVLRDAISRDAAIEFARSLHDAASADQWKAAGFEVPEMR
jgi:molybdate transport system substrate-binding protein